MKKPSTRIGFPPSRTTFSSSTGWILRGCKHPKTLSFACDDQKENEEKQGGGEGDGDSDGDEAATLSDIDRFLLENFKSLYKEDDDGGSRAKSEEDEVLNIKGGGVLMESPRLFMEPSAEDININGSRRFFVAPGSSSSLMEEAQTSQLTTNTSEDIMTSSGFGFAFANISGSTSTGTSDSSSSCNDSARTSSYSAKEVLSPDDFITVLTYSNSPYDDFKKSMQEMIEARLKHNGKIDWEFMEELLFCYLNLNDKKSYRFILRAFVDMIIFLRRQNRPC